MDALALLLIGAFDRSPWLALACLIAILAVICLVIRSVGSFRERIRWNRAIRELFPDEKERLRCRSRHR